MIDSQLGILLFRVLVKFVQELAIDRLFEVLQNLVKEMQFHQNGEVLMKNTMFNVAIRKREINHTPPENLIKSLHRMTFRQCAHVENAQKKVAFFGSFLAVQ